MSLVNEDVHFTCMFGIYTALKMHLRRLSANPLYYDWQLHEVDKWFDEHILDFA